MDDILNQALYKFKASLIFVLIFISIGQLVAQSNEPLVEVSSLDSSIVIDLKYASTDNFLGIKIYSSDRCFLRKSVAERLLRVQKRLQKMSLGLKIWDAYRPLSAQKVLWQHCSNPRYVAPPGKGSRHNRGAAVDVTLVDSLGNELEMPTKFDDFTRKAAPDNPAVSQKAKLNRKILIDAMIAEGFKGISSEWWHYDAPHYRQYPVLDVPIEKL